PEEHAAEEQIAGDGAAVEGNSLGVTIQQPLERITVGPHLLQPGNEVRDEEVRQACRDRSTADSPGRMASPQERPAKEWVESEGGVYGREREVIRVAPVRRHHQIAGQFGTEHHKNARPETDAGREEQPKGTEHCEVVRSVAWRKQREKGG